MRTSLFAILIIAISPISLWADTLYVDAAAGSGGDGASWGTAFSEINDAAYSNLQGGDVVLIKTGAYSEYVNISSDGEELLPITYNVTVTGSRVHFPAGTDLGNVQADGLDYVYVCRSRLSNNGVFAITGGGEDYVETAENFVTENGKAGDKMELSAAIGRPVQYIGYTPNNGDEALLTGSGSGFYIEKADFNIFSNITIRNSLQSFNQQMGGSFNLVHNSRVESITDMNGIQVGVSTAEHPNRYNFIINNVITDPQVEGIYIGAGGQGESKNHTDFTHVIDNEIYTSMGNTKLENAIDLKEYNKGSVVEGNYIHDIKLMTNGNGAIDIRQGHDHALIYGNTFENIHATKTYQPVIKTYSPAKLEIYNNSIYNTENTGSEDIYAWISKAEEAGAEIYFYNNTIHNIPLGMWMENTGGDIGVHNNIFSVVGANYIRQWEDYAQTVFSNNLFSSDPGWAPESNATETGRLVSDSVLFVNAQSGGFSLLPGSKAIDAGSSHLYPAYDFQINKRDMMPDIGAYEHGQPTGLAGKAESNGEWLKVYPNPAGDQIRLMLKGTACHARVGIFDAQGRELLYKAGISNNETINISSLSRGLYYIKVMSIDKTEYERIIKQ